MHLDLFTAAYDPCTSLTLISTLVSIFIHPSQNRSFLDDTSAGTTTSLNAVLHPQPAYQSSQQLRIARW